MDSTKLLTELTQIIERAEIRMAREDWKGANESLMDGLNKLGEDYHLPSVTDDTGQKLVVAITFERKDDLEKAANLRLRILKERFDMYQDKCKEVFSK
jgi:hypothetical protein